MPHSSCSCPWLSTAGCLLVSNRLWRPKKAALRQSKQTLLAGKSPTKIDVSEKENHLKMGGFICVHFSSICLWAQKVFSTLMALFLAHSIFSATMQRCEEVYNFNKDDCMLAASVFLAILSFNGLV
jgi:hypothetical protein